MGAVAHSIAGALACVADGNDAGTRSAARRHRPTRRRVAATFAAFGDGELSVDQVVTVAKYTPAHNDTEVCELAKSATVSQLRSALSRYVHVEPAEAVAPVDEALAGGDSRNSLVKWFDENGRYTLQLDAPTDQGEIVNQAIREARDALFLSGHQKVTWLEAFVEVCKRSSAPSPARTDAIDSARTCTSTPTTVAGRRTRGSTVVPRCRTRSATCCSAMGSCSPCGTQRDCRSTSAEPATSSRRHTRRQILDRDRSCLRPGCNATTHLEVHHIQDWLDGGPTQTSNLGALCDHDHDALHRGEFTMVGNPDVPGDLQFFDRRGRSDSASRQTEPTERACARATIRQELQPPNRRTVRHPMVPTH